MSMVLETVVRSTENEIVDVRLRQVFALAEEARKKGVLTVANKLCGYLLALALDDDPQEKLLLLDIATTDLYGNQREQTKFDLVVVTYKHDERFKTRIPIRVLTEDAQGRCRRRVGDQMIQRQPPRGTAGRWIPPSLSEIKNLEDRFTRIIGKRDVDRIHNILNSP